VVTIMLRGIGGTSTEWDLIRSGLATERRGTLRKDGWTRSLREAGEVDVLSQPQEEGVGLSL
jgi:hypothetical protein